MTEEEPSTAQRISSVIRSPKRATLALMRRSPLRSLVARLELIDAHQARLNEQQARSQAQEERIEALLCRIAVLEQRITDAAQLVNVHHEWFAGVQTRANAHHDWIVGQSKHLEQLQEYVGNAVARANTTDLHLTDYAARIVDLERLVDSQHNLLHLQNIHRIMGQRPAPLTAKISLLFDIRITQVARRERGISRYTASLALALGCCLPGQISFLIDPDEPLPDQIEDLRACGRIINGTKEIPLLSSLTHFLQGCVFNLSNTTEDLFPVEIAPFRPQIWAIFYDLVPLIFPKEYLQDEFASRRYKSLLRALPFVDRHLAISRTSGDDLTRLVGIPESQVSVIMGGIDVHRWPINHERLAAPLSVTNGAGKVFSLTAPFWLYVGGNDFRKNLKGLIEAFALLRANPLSPAPQLVIACHIPPDVRDELYAFAVSFRLEIERDVVITGWIDDFNLSLCYRAAFATVFPSLYEGLGLPILESYFFGTPALASNSSSLREITAPECQFDPASPQSIADAMLRLHRDPAMAEASLAWGKEMLKLCDWTAIASRVAQLLQADLQALSRESTPV